MALCGNGLIFLGQHSANYMVSLSYGPPKLNCTVMKMKLTILVVDNRRGAKKEIK